MQDVSSLVAQAREGRPRAVARLISLVEGASAQLREVMAALAPMKEPSPDLHPQEPPAPIDDRRTASAGLH